MLYLWQIIEFIEYNTDTFALVLIKGRNLLSFETLKTACSEIVPIYFVQFRSMQLKRPIRPSYDIPAVHHHPHLINQEYDSSS